MRVGAGSRSVSPYILTVTQRGTQDEHKLRSLSLNMERPSTRRQQPQTTRNENCSPRSLEPPLPSPPTKKTPHPPSESDATRDERRPRTDQIDRYLLTFVAASSEPVHVHGGDGRGHLRAPSPDPSARRGGNKGVRGHHEPPHARKRRRPPAGGGSQEADSSPRAPTTAAAFRARCYPRRRCRGGVVKKSAPQAHPLVPGGGKQKRFLPTTTNTTTPSCSAVTGFREHADGRGPGGERGDDSPGRVRR